VSNQDIGRVHSLSPILESRTRLDLRRTQSARVGKERVRYYIPRIESLAVKADALVGIADTVELASGQRPFLIKNAAIRPNDLIRTVNALTTRFSVTLAPNRQPQWESRRPFSKSHAIGRAPWKYYDMSLLIVNFPSVKFSSAQCGTEQGTSHHVYAASAAEG
jgi:hypothetical protein